jgi:hypothetical protein
MLKIRPEQYEVFKPVAEEVFTREIVAYLRKAYADRVVKLPNGPTTIEGLSEEKLRLMVKGGITRARRYDLTGKASLITFVVIMFLTAPNFDEHPLIKHVLTSQSVPPDARIDELWQRTVDQNWVAVRTSYDPEVWTTKPEETKNEL